MSERPIAVYGPPGGQVRFNSADYGPTPIIAVDDVNPGRYPFPSVHNNPPGHDTLVNVFFEQRGHQDVPVPGFPFYGHQVKVPADPVNDWFLLPQDPAVMAAHPHWFQLPPLVPDMKPLRANDQMIEHVDGSPWTAIECSDFNLLARYVQEGEAAIRPVLAQRRDIGFNLLRVWTLYDIPKIGRLTPCPYDRIPAFVGLCATYGLRVEFTAYTGANPAHWDQLVAACQQCSPTPLLEYVNELDVNKGKPEADGSYMDCDRGENGGENPVIVSHGQRIVHAKPAGLLCSHGSNGSQSWPVFPLWDYGTFHTNGANEEQRKIGHNAMEIANDVPMITNETSRFPEVGMWGGADLERQKQLAFDSAAGAALLCAGACFHSVQGKTSELFDAEHEAVARAWVAGVKSVDLQFQHGNYERHEPPDPFLRRYVRGGSPEVQIRK